MGKGGCELAEAGVNCIRGIVGCFCCCICIGPILLIVGITMLSVHNNYDSYVGQYNSAVGTFETAYKNLVLSTTGSVANTYSLFPVTAGTSAPLSPQFSGTLPDSSSEGVTVSGMSYPLKTQSSIDLSNSQPASITFTPPASGPGSTFAANSVNFTLQSAGQQTPRQITLSCSSSQIDNRESCQTVCQRQYPCGNYGGSGSYCRYSSSCSNGYCTATSYSSLSCSQFDIDNATGSVSRPFSQTGCLYPFSSNTQPSTCNRPSTIPVFFMNSKDPFIRIQQITGDSSFSFGLTKSQQRNIGMALIGVGAAITGLVICGAILIYKSIFKSDKSATTVYSAFGRTYVPVNGVPPQNTNYNPQAQYGQQPAAGNYYDNNNNFNQYQQQPQMQYQQQPQMYQQGPPPQQQQQMYYQQQQPNPGYSVVPPPGQQMMMMPQPQQQYNHGGYGAPPQY